VTSQVDPTQSWAYTIDMEVIEFDFATIESESNPSVLRPDSTVYLQYTISNQGNTELTFYPNVDDRPGGWSVIVGLDSITIPEGESSSYLLGLEGNGLAIGGSLTLHMTTQDGYRISWEGGLNVIEEAKPVLTFMGISDSEGNSISEIPVGAPGFIGHWLIFNDGSSDWTPTLSIDLPDDTWDGVCDPVGEVSAGSSIEANCILTAPSMTPAGWGPEIGLTINADGIERSAGALIGGANIPVVGEPSVVWTTLSMEESKEGLSSLLHFRIQNTGNTHVQERLIVAVPEGWSVEVQGSDIVDLPLGESQDFRVLVTPDSSGEAAVDLSLENSNTPGSTHSASIDVASDPSRSAGGGIGTTFAIIGLIVFIIVGLGVAGILIMRLREPNSPPTAPPPSPNVFKESKAPENPQNSAIEVVCWGCNKPVGATRRACPNCGARYHESGYACSASALTVCRNCQADVNTFVEEASS